MRTIGVRKLAALMLLGAITLALTAMVFFGNISSSIPYIRGGWPRFFEPLTYMFYFTVFLSSLFIVIGLVGVATPLVVDFIIRRTGGLKTLVGLLVWCLSIVVAGVGIFFLLVSILAFVLLFAEPFPIYDTAYLLGEVSFGLLAVLVGAGVFRFLGGRSRLLALEHSPPSIEEVARMRAATSRWGFQWCNAVGVAVVILLALQFTATVPPWLASEEPVHTTWTQLLTVVAIGVVWACADAVIPKSAWRRLRAVLRQGKRDSELDAASPTRVPRAGAEG